MNESHKLIVLATISNEDINQSRKNNSDSTSYTTEIIDNTNNTIDASSFSNNQKVIYN
jgi:hypothetical protein